MCICAGKDSEFSADIGNANTLTLIYLSKEISLILKIAIYVE